MKSIRDQHLEAMENIAFVVLKDEEKKSASQACEKITEEVAIKFKDWCDRFGGKKQIKHSEAGVEFASNKYLFKQFKKEVYGE